MGALFGFQRRQFAPEPVIPPFPKADIAAGLAVNGSSGQTEQALAVPAAYASIDLLSAMVSLCTLHTFRKTKDATAPPERIADLDLLERPSGKLTQAEWLAQIMVSLLTAGNLYAHMPTFDDLGQPTSLDIYSPAKLQVAVDDDGVITYKQRRTQQPVPASNVWHVAGMTLPGQTIGLSPIAFAAATLGIDISSRKFAADFFDGGGIPKAVLTSDQYVDQTKARLIKDRFMAAFKNREPMVLGSGVKYAQIQVRPEESQFLKTQEANVSQVARYFRVPPEMIGGSGGNSMTYANVEQRFIDFLTISLAPWLTRLEQAISALLVGPVFVKFDTSAILRIDAETAAKVSVQHVAAKVLAPSEVRQDLGRPPMTEAQKTEANLVPLSITPNGGAKALQGLKDPLGPVAPVPTDDAQPPTPT